MSNIDDEVRETIESFVEQLKGLIQRAALESVQNALSGGQQPLRKGSKRQVAHAAAAAPQYETGSKRSPAELAALIKRLHSHIVKNPGLRIEKIGDGLGVPTKALVLPVKRLISEKRITTKGQKRATVYFAH
jgi:DNA-binding NtrC family response regulator